MARARNIKPSFFKNELLVELPFEYRLLFIGLWTMADRDGRLEDRPKRIKMEIFPADNVDVDTGIAELESMGFLERYTANDVRVISIINFTKHQSPHHTEKKSDLPAKCSLTKDNKPLDNGESPVIHARACVEIPLNPDSLNPESMIPSLSERGKPNEGAHENESAPATSPAGEVCRRLKRAGITDVNPSHAKLVALLQAGLTVSEIADIGPEAMTKRKGFAWILATAEGRRREAENVTPLPQRQPGGRHAPGIGAHKPSLAERATAARIEAQRLAGGGPVVEPVGADDAHVRAPLDGDFRRVGDE